MEKQLKPAIRFKGFTDPWELRKFSDLAETRRGLTYNPSSISDSGIRVLRSSNIAEDQFIYGEDDVFVEPDAVNIPKVTQGDILITSANGSTKITEQGYDNSSAKLLPPGTVLFTSRAGIGKTAILACKGCTNQGFQSLVPHKDKLDSYFIFSRTEELKRYGELVGAGSTFVEVSGKQMAAMDIMMPSTLQEQQTIGRLFSAFDHLITLHQRKSPH